MNSTIINMVDRMKDADDRMLETLFASEPLADDGFSARIETRIRRRLWVRRLTLPVAAIIGGSIAIKPLATLLTLVFELTSLLPSEFTQKLASSALPVPTPTTLVLGGVLVALVVAGARMLED